MKKIRAGVIGLGRSGYDIHVHTMALLPEMYEIAAVTDPIEARVSDAKKKHGCNGYSSYESMLDAEDLDLVVNAAPSHLHVPVSLDAMDRGFDVLCDKPLARRASEVDSLIAKRVTSGKRIFVYQQSRFAPYFREVGRVIATGDLGRVVMIKIAFNGFSRRWDWQTLQEYNGGNLLNTGPHPLDQALQLFGDAEDPKVFCLMDRANTYGNAEDHVKLILHGDKSPTIDLEISSCSAHTPYTYQVYGTRGSLTGTMTHLEWKYFRENEAPKQRLLREPLDGRVYCREDLPWHEGSWDVPEGESNLLDTTGLSLYRDLHAGLAERKETVVKIEQVRRQIAVIEECHRQNPLSTGIPQLNLQ